ncbi:heat shock protein beta-9 [Solea solea]|uniref:heat shock protein beta-9 n=1 Tax=Solea solea TaxID=90069 RepID=UPI00272C2BB3|nr:heat shock protein beta-9 [Solea solea]
MMSQRAAFTSLFADDPFFSQDRLLWPMNHGVLSSLQQDFFNRRSNLADSLLRELDDEHPLLKLSPLPLLSSTLTGLTDAKEQKETSNMELQKNVQHHAEKKGDLLVTLDARGYAPSDITIKLEGRSLAVVAMKQAGAEESETCSSSTSCAAFHAAASSKAGFAQKIDLPAHLDLSGLSCSLMDDGQLRIHAPVAKLPISEEEQEGPARFRSSLEFPIKKDKTGAEHTD